MVPLPRTVGGIVLRPFCLGHHLLMRKVGLPFAGNSEADCGPEDIIVGVIICGMTYERALLAITECRLPKLIRSWRRRMLGWWIHGRPTMEDIELGFRAYLKEGYTMPPVWSYPAGGISMTAPWEVLLKTKLMSYGLTERDVLTGYLPSRWYEYFAALEWDSAQACEDPKSWRKVFFTAEDAERIGNG